MFQTDIAQTHIIFSLRCLFPRFLAAFDYFGVLLYCKNKLTSVFYASVVLLIINYVITLSKFFAEPLDRGSWFHSCFDNVLEKFIIYKRTEAYFFLNFTSLSEYAVLKSTIKFDSGLSGQLFNKGKKYNIVGHR